MSRLTEWQNGELLVKEEERLLNANEIITKDEMYKIMRHLAEKLADYEDKQEQGLLIELPCKVGDTVYLINHFMVESRKKPIKCTVNEFLIEGSGHCHAVLDGTEAFYAMKRFRAVKLEEFGKTLFLTLSEAEEALAKMGGK